MSAPLSTMLIDGLVTMSTKVAVDGLVKIATPPGVRAVSTFLIKGGSFFVGAIIASRLSKIAVKSGEELSAIVKAQPVPVSITSVDPPQETGE